MKNRFNLLPFASFIFGVGIGDNNVDPMVPEWWANESVMILEENMIMANLVHRDFENILMESGEVVNTRKPGEFVMKRKANGDPVTHQAVTSTNIEVRLNQHMHVTFGITDREQAKSFKDLVATYLHPAVLAIARGVDKVLLSQAPRFIRTDNKTSGSLGVDASVASILNTRRNLNDDKAPTALRTMILSSKDETALLNLDIFINADKVGDDGTSLREASLGRRLGFNHYMCQNVCSVTGTSDVATTMLVNNASGYAAGSQAAAATQALTVDGFTGAAVVGSWLTISTAALNVGTEGLPHRITACTNNTAGNTISITITPPLRTAVADNAVITLYDPGAVNQPTASVAAGGSASLSGYIAGWEKPIEVDGFTHIPQVGQWVQFVANGALYVVIENPTATTILLDRPLEVAIANDDIVIIGPNGTFNFAFLRNAIALVCRPMAIPRPGMGVSGATANYKGVSMRVCWQYNIENQETVVTVDTLMGVAILEQLLGEVMLG